MATELRIGFAMGGGVSLGSFSGAALSEAIILLLMARSADGTLKYDPVKIDIFSGASAGALSLSLMLRSLATRSPEQEIQTKDVLVGKHGDRFSALPEERQREIIAAQMVQDLQEEVWAKQVNIDLLLGGSTRSLKFEPGIIDRKAVETIAYNYLGLKEDSSFDNRELLADRVLFAFTLTNLTPVISGAVDEYPGSQNGFIGLADGMRSSVHTELRVFDLNFTPIKKTEVKKFEERWPKRWCRYHNKSEIDGTVGNLNSRETWAKIAATAIGCGAFPFAFEPVVLTRRDYEYGKLWPEQFINAGVTEHGFTYVDGGVFNNEPIREAFRLASFVDSQSPDDVFERLIIFVDPFVDAKPPTLRVPVHQAWFVGKPNPILGVADLVRRTTLDRLLPNLGSIIGALADEGRVIEADKIFQVRRRFELRNNIRIQLDEVLNQNVKAADLAQLIKYCSDILDKDLTEMMIPPGPLEVPEELARIIWEERGGILKGLDGPNTLQAAKDMVSDPSNAPSRELWLRTLTFLAVDLILDLEGKWDDVKLVAIAPFKNLRNNPQEVKLPGGAIAGFAGFMSPDAGKISVDAGRYCAQEFLNVCGIISEPPTLEAPDIDAAAAEPLRKRIGQDIELGVRKLSDRVQQVISTSHLINVFPGLDTLIKSLVAYFAKRMTLKLTEAASPTTEYEFRIRCFDGSDLEFDRSGFGNDVEPVKDEQNGNLVLITFAELDQADNWAGIDVHQENGRAYIEVDQGSILSVNDRLFCQIEMPDAHHLAEADLLGYPAFEIELSETDKGQKVSRARWQIVSRAQPLEKTILLPAHP